MFASGRFEWRRVLLALWWDAVLLHLHLLLFLHLLPAFADASAFAEGGGTGHRTGDRLGNKLLTPISVFSSKPNKWNLPGQCDLTILQFLAKNQSMSRPFSAESVFRALAHRTRRRVVESLRKGNRFAGDILDDADLRMPTLSEHLRVLRQCDLIRCHRRGTRMEYELNTLALRQARAWLEMVSK
jgi:DNA-binding transcriptional ArsR family regulator